MKKIICIVSVSFIPQQLHDFIFTIQEQINNEIVILKTITEMESAGMFY